MTESGSLAPLLEGARAVVFDFDNIVVDSEPFHYEAYNRVFSRHGHALDRTEYWREWTSKGGGAEGEIARHRLDLDPDEIRREKDPIYSAFCRSGEIRPFPAAVRAIDLLAGAGFRLAVASGSYTRDIEAILGVHGLDGRFAAVVGKDQVALPKPHPETFERACRLIGESPERCVAVEDAEKGVLSARAAGMRVVLIETDITRDLDIGGADAVLPSIDRFAQALEGTL